MLRPHRSGRRVRAHRTRHSRRQLVDRAVGATGAVRRDDASAPPCHRVASPLPPIGATTWAPSSRPRHTAGAKRRARTPNAQRVVEMQAASGVGHRHHAGEPAEPVLEHPGVGSSVGWVVVEHDDPFGGDHRARRPREHVEAGDVVGDAEEVDPVEQRRHLPAGDRQAARLAEDRRHVGAVRGDDSRSAGRQCSTNSATTSPLRSSRRWSRARTASSAELISSSIIRPLVRAPRQFVHGVHGVGEPELVQALEVAQPAATLAVGGGELGVALEDVGSPCVQAQVDGVARAGRRRGRGRRPRAPAIRR